jgi:hypothetical protein
MKTVILTQKNRLKLSPKKFEIVGDFANILIFRSIKLTQTSP